MKRVSVFLATGFEECEALLIVDLLRRAKVYVTTVSVSGDYQVEGSHGIEVTADSLFEEMDYSDQDMLVLPGGIPGTPNLREHEGLCSLIRRFDKEGRYLAAVCAAPSIYAELGFLYNKKGTSHPSRREIMEEKGVFYTEQEVVEDGHFITSRGLGTCIPFGLKLIEILAGDEQAEKVRDAIVYREPSRKKEV